jgi:multiple sugar transport system permease protein
MFSSSATKYRGFRSEFSRSEVRMAYLILLPALIPLLLFVVLPLFGAVILSFTNFDAFRLHIQPIGLTNYIEALKSPLFHITVRNTLEYMIGYVPLQMLVGLLAALLLNREIRGISFLRGAYYLPVLTSVIAMGVVWSWLFQPQGGLVSQVVRAFGGQPKNLLGSPDTAMTAVIGVAVWKTFGRSMLIYLAGLQGIPEMYYEAAKIDGAGSWQMLWHITWPLLRPVTFYLFIIGVIQSLQVFGLIMILTDGGPAFRTTSIVHQIYLNAFRFNRMGYASSMAVLLFLGIAILTYLNWRFFSSAIEY